MRATGTFEVKLETLPLHEALKEPTVGRRSMAKVFHGELEAVSSGEMLSAAGNAKGSAVYVAIEIVTGKLGPRSGSFALHHSGIMNRGGATLSVGVVPDSGTGELEGLSGGMQIIIENGAHRYEFEYELPVR